MDKDLTFFKKLIEGKGYKFTKQKQSVLKTLVESNIHLNAEEIYKKVKEFSISLATVYRSLKMFSQLDIIKEMNINGVNYYEMKIFSAKPLHIHFRCIRCNKIIDIDNKSLDYLRINRIVEKENNLTVYDANIMLIGLCSKCRELEKFEGKSSI